MTHSKNMGVLQIILLAGSFQGFILALLLLNRKTNKIANRILSLFILVVSMQMLLVAADSKSFYMQFPHISRIGWLLPTLFGPLIYLYSKSLTQSYNKFSIKDLWVFVPFLIYLLLLTPYFLQTTEEKLAYLKNYESTLQDDFKTLNEITNYIHLIFVSLSIYHLSVFRRRLLSFYSEVEKIQLKWLGQLLWILFILIVFSILVFYSKRYDMPVLSKVYPYHYWGVVVIFYWIVYKALLQPQLFHFDPEPETTKSAQPGDSFRVKYEHSPLTAEAVVKYTEQIRLFMETKKPYLNSELNLNELSSQVGISKHIISQVMNEKLHMNFFDFINSYRVMEAKQMLINPTLKHLTILGIGMEAGFNSKSTFNTAFKKITGMTPTEYVKNYRKEV